MSDDANLDLNRNIVRAALGGDPVETQTLFNQAIDARVQDRVDSLRAGVAAAYFTQPEAQEPVNDSDD